MSLSSALQLGRSALQVNQTALEVTGNNLANAATEGYSRQQVITSPAQGQEIMPGTFVGAGVKLEQIVRSVDEALMGRLRSATSDNQAAMQRRDLLSQIESIHNELADEGLNTQLSQFFNSWSQLANNPGDNSLRTLVVQQGKNLSDFIRDLHGRLTTLRQQVDGALRGNVNSANGLLDQIAQINNDIARTERGQGSANSLRDERDRLLNDLGELVDISTVEQTNGTVDVFIGSTPIVLGSSSRGLRLEFQGEGADVQPRLRVDADGTYLQPSSGKIGQLMTGRSEDMVAAVDALSEFTGQLIFQVNRVHSQGQGREHHASVTGSYAVDDITAGLAGATADLPFQPGHGSFQLHVTQQSTGSRVTSQINVDLDGLGGADMSLADLRDAINADPTVSPYVTASITVEGALKIDADSADFKFSFSDDSSGVLAALGINTFFTGSKALDIDVNDALGESPGLLATGQGHVPGDASNAVAIATLQDQGIGDLNGLSLRDYWTRHIEDYAIRTSQAGQEVSSTGVVLSSLQAQRESVSGVNLDAEAINLLAYERAYQGAARFISVVDRMMQTLIGMVQ